jgi:hypothetical protein
MRRWTVMLVFASGVVAGCMAAGPPLPAQSPLGVPGSRYLGVPLVLDRADFRLGTTVQFPRIPSETELYELGQISGLAHVVLTLEEWPRGYAEVAPLRQLSPEADLIVVLPGFPPSREAAEAWNLLDVRLRIVLVVEGAPASTMAITDLNAMRGLERVIVDTTYPARAGFERLQRPLSFRIVRD